MPAYTSSEDPNPGVSRESLGTWRLPRSRPVAMLVDLIAKSKAYHTFSFDVDV